MAKRIKAYRAYVEELLQKEGLDWEQVRKEHMTQLGFFQHERLIHLLVTLAFALMEVILLTATIQSCNPGLLLLTLAILILLIPYIRHYYLLENEVQAMYRQYDAILEKLGQDGFSLK
ncbi:MAG: hypothetical protein IJW37_02815 [Lachnospiraceae bacterium]|nr:hypothetical protein [Lachnospiraceae bacterium]